MLNRRTPKTVSLTDLADSIEKITGDDELLTKVSLRYLRDLHVHLINRHPPPEGFFNSIFQRNWPYSNSPPAPDEFPVQRKRLPSSPAGEELTAREADYLARIQKDLGRRIKGVELCSLCRSLSALASVHLAKKQIVSKQRMLAWLVQNEETIGPHFDGALAEWIASRRTEEG